MTNEEVESKINKITAIWGIENMVLSETFKNNARAFLKKEITYEEFEERGEKEMRNELSKQDK